MITFSSEIFLRIIDPLFEVVRMTSEPLATLDEIVPDEIETVSPDPNIGIGGMDKCV